MNGILVQLDVQRVMLGFRRGFLRSRHYSVVADDEEKVAVIARGQKMEKFLISPAVSDIVTGDPILERRFRPYLHLAPTSVIHLLLERFW